MRRRSEDVHVLETCEYCVHKKVCLKHHLGERGCEDVRIGLVEADKILPNTSYFKRFGDKFKYVMVYYTFNEAGKEELGPFGKIITPQFGLPEVAKCTKDGKWEDVLDGLDIEERYNVTVTHWAPIYDPRIDTRNEFLKYIPKKEETDEDEV